MSAPQTGAPTPGPYRVVRSSEDGNFYVEGFLCETNTCERGEADRDCSLVNEAYAAGLEAARNEEQESLRRIAVQASALGDCECSEEIGELCNRCALVDIIGRRIAAIRALAGADQKGARG